MRWSGPEIKKTFSMLNSTENEIFPAHKCENANNFWHFNIYEREKIHFYAYLSLKIADFLFIFFILTSILNFILNWVEHEKSFIASGPGYILL